MTENHYCKDSHKDNIDDLIDYLNTWQKDSAIYTQFYRGQPIVAPLKPSLFRDDINLQLEKFKVALELDQEILNADVQAWCDKIDNSLTHNMDKSKNKNKLTPQQREAIARLILKRHFEQFLLSSFFKIANAAGLSVNYSSIHHKLYDILPYPYKQQPLQHMPVGQKYLNIKSDYLCYLFNDKTTKKTPLNQPELKFIATLAQHHGVPTRLLDFTRSALKAAFFACYQSPKRDEAINSAKLIAVYRVRITDKEKSMIEFVTENDHNLNKFLFAQEGLFAVLFGDRYFIDHNRWPSIEDLSDEYGGLEVERVTFPKEKSWELLNYLNTAHGISISKLMPHYNHVAEELMIRLKNLSNKDNLLM